MKNLAAVLIPIYQAHLADFEKISLRRCFEVLGNHPVIFIAPHKLDVSLYQKNYPTARFEFFEADYFSSIKKYSCLMTRPFFYKRFLDFRYILIYQTDVFVFGDELKLWCDKGYDYIGAPWLNTTWMKEFAQKKGLPFLYKYLNRVGNGGFSLRKVRTFYNLSRLYAPLTLKMKLNEDIFWSNNPARYLGLFKTPTPKIALSFAFEETPQKAYEQNGFKLPFAVHAWQKYDTPFWKTHFEKYGYSIN